MALRESFINVIGGEMSIPLQSFTIRITEKVIKEVRYNGNNYFLNRLIIAKGYKSAVCTEGKCILRGIEEISQGSTVRKLMN